MELTITLNSETDRVALLGPAERNLKIIREALGISITARGDSVRLSGEGGAVNRAAGLIAQLTDAIKRKSPMSRSELFARIQQATEELDDAIVQPTGQRSDALDVYMPGKRIKAKTEGQQTYIQSIRDHDMIFCTGPAGTGKTYLAVASAVAMLKRGQTRKLVLVRPAVEAGEKLGFLPGDMQEKVNPYLRPLLDALHDMMPFDQVQRFMHGDLIEVVPLAFMRGRTLNDAVVICDEAQNTTKSQMLMLLTRLGQNSKMIITGDTSQTDLPDQTESGLLDAIRRLKRINGIDFICLTGLDIVRHTLVTQIVHAYDAKPGNNRRE